MDVGAVGAAGTAGTSVSPAPQAQAATPDNGAPTNVQSDTSETGAEAAPCGGDSGNAMANPGLSTQDFFQLHQTVQGVSSPESADFNMQKLLELIIAMKLLEEVGKQ
jgi:hypothetical protein